MFFSKIIHLINMNVILLWPFLLWTMKYKNAKYLAISNAEKSLIILPLKENKSGKTIGLQMANDGKKKKIYIFNIIK